ncbi:MAG TPA: EAL domain-containing protein [Egibacteraceae bacterium]|nr:EAL domain-containing protein [Egibacteraceae bacterium]
MRLRSTAHLRLHVAAVGLTAAVGVAAAAPRFEAAMAAGGTMPWLLGAAVAAGAWANHLRPRAADDAVGSPGVGLALPAAFALLLVAGSAPAVTVLFAVLTVTALAKLRVVAAVEHVAVPVTAILGAAGSLWLTSGHADVLAAGSPSPREVAGVVVAGVVLYAVQVGLSAATAALGQGVAVWRHVAQELAAHVSTGAVLLSVAPIAVVVAATNPALVPVLAVPVLAGYRNARVVVATQHLAHHDALTGLPNRRLFVERLEMAIHDAAEDGRAVAVLLIDLDRFKEVNDTLGHHVGDLLLQAVGSALASRVDPDVTVARMGGDEFALCVPDVDGADEAVRVAKSVVARLSQPFRLESYTVDVGASVGIALCPAHATDVSTALQRADIAMYVAKETRGGYEVYSEERDPQRRQRIQSPGELRRAAEMDQLLLHFQPKVEIATGHVRGVEALVRWNHPDLGLIGPTEFIPLAERAGLMGPITTFVLARALEQVRAWADAGKQLRLSVNLSVQSLYDDAFPGLVAGLLDRSSVAASDLVLDVTESTVMADPRRAQRVLAELGTLGVTLAIDDFGTGYSSLSYLKQLPVSELKIDKSFVLGMANDSDDAIIVHSTIDLGQKFGLEVVAEGVESNRVWTLLGRLGCDLAQGSYVCPPQPAEALTPWLAERTTSAETTGTDAGRVPAS